MILPLSCAGDAAPRLAYLRSAMRVMMFIMMHMQKITRLDGDAPF